MKSSHTEKHRTQHVGWLRAAVLGANDGIVSVASLIVGVAAASVSINEILIAGVAGLVAGAMSMAAGEYVSVSSQADTEKADIARELKELEDDHEHEVEELTNIYVGRGLEKGLASQVAIQLMAHDAIGAHARDELGISEILTAKPTQAAFSSAGAFAVGAIMPLLAVIIFPQSILIPCVAITSLFFLGLLGMVSAKVGGSPILKAVLRVSFWGALAMGLTAGVGALFGVAV
ncbi:MAG: hypothetical protein COW71_00855 [Ignavibacteriales bacterium CG18_big_fil_WC_8_21_14_2_50_31_20]|nr:MAG: hypothetical protein COW71_00855 [Ignavibacteriales bacterium CG18_big_fil_WC_8_21_14_2_50_31_20]